MATNAALKGISASAAVGRARAGVRVWVDLFREHELLGYASAIARTMLVAAVSIVLLLLGVAGAIGRQDLWSTHVAPQIQKRVLPDVYAGINQTVERIFRANSPGLIVFAALLAVWEVSGSVRGVSGALNRIYETPETRSWRLRYPLSFALALVVNLALIAALLLTMALGGAVHGSASLPFAIARWLLAVFLIAFAFGLLVRFASARRRAKKWDSIGAVLVVSGWIVESLVFKWYIDTIANFHTAVGSLAVVLVMISYLYVAAIILLVGIEVDELLRRNDDEAERTLLSAAHGLAGLFTPPRRPAKRRGRA